jgi:hypothetical protein
MNGLEVKFVGHDFQLFKTIVLHVLLLRYKDFGEI